MALLALLSGCDRASAPGSRIDNDNPLEIAARERGVVRADTANPTGAYERTHELGRDAMCVVPDGVGQWHFAITASFGPGLSCRAGGTLRREGDAWRLRFAGADGCETQVREEEDELRLPGDLPPQCENLCPSRASLAGLRLPRASWSESDARGLRMRDGRGKSILPCGA